MAKVYIAKISTVKILKTENILYMRQQDIVYCFILSYFYQNIVINTINKVK